MLSRFDFFTLETYHLVFFLGKGADFFLFDLDVK